MHEDHYPPAAAIATTGGPELLPLLLPPGSWLDRLAMPKEFASATYQTFSYSTLKLPLCTASCILPNTPKGELPNTQTHCLANQSSSTHMLNDELSGTSICMTMLPRDALASSTKSASHPISSPTRCRTKPMNADVLGDEPGKAVS
jgi:hypothetical protein